MKKTFEESMQELSAEQKGLMIAMFDSAKAKAGQDRERNPNLRVLFVPSAELRVSGESPCDVYYALSSLLGDGYTWDEIEWEVN